MENLAEIELLERSRRGAIILLRFSIFSLGTLLLLRFVPAWNDALSGDPHYARILTETSARQFASQTHAEAPVIVEKNESGRWPQAKEQVPESDYVGIIYMLLYSEKEHLTCTVAYVIPASSAKFSNVYTITPEQGENYGPPLLRPAKAVPVNVSIHVYSPEYLKTLHWRYKPHLPLTPAEGASMAGHYSANKQAEGSASIELNYEELRAEVAKDHNLLNFRLTLLLGGFGVLLLGTAQRLVSNYKRYSRYCHVYHLEVGARAFLKSNFGATVAAGRAQFFEKQRETEVQLREQEKLRLLRIGWETNLRAALAHLDDERLRANVHDLLQTESPNLERIKTLWLEIQEKAGQKTPVERLDLLLESIRPYCTEAEFQECRAEAFAVLKKSGFRPARKLAIAFHDHFKARAREMEELEKNGAREAS